MIYKIILYLIVINKIKIFYKIAKYICRLLFYLSKNLKILTFFLLIKNIIIINKKFEIL